MTQRDSDALRAIIERGLSAALADLNSPNRKYWYPLSRPTYGAEEGLEALDSMTRFSTTMWDKTRLFERGFADYNGGGEAVMVNSGSSADLLLAHLLTNPLKPLLKPGDEVL